MEKYILRSEIDETFRKLKLWVSIFLLQGSIIFISLALYAIHNYEVAFEVAMKSCPGACNSWIAPSFPYWTGFMLLAFVGILIGVIGIISNLKRDQQ